MTGRSSPRKSLAKAEVGKALVAFLESLTGDNIDELTRDARSAPVGNPALPEDNIGSEAP